MKVLGHGYWSLPNIEKRIVYVIKRKPRRWTKKLAALRKARQAVLAMPRPDKLVKGWKSEDRRRERVQAIRRMCRSKSYSQVGKKFGITKQRVHQLVNDPRWR